MMFRLYMAVSSAPDKQGVIQRYFVCLLIKTYFETPHDNHLSKTVQMRCHDVCFYRKIRSIIPNFYPFYIMQHCIEDSHICYHLHRQETGIASGLGVPFPTSDDGGCCMIRLVFGTLI